MSEQPPYRGLIFNGAVYETAAGFVYLLVYIGCRRIAPGSAGFLSEWGLLSLAQHTAPRRTAPMFQHDYRGDYVFTTAVIREMLGAGAKLTELRADFEPIANERRYV